MRKWLQSCHHHVANANKTLESATSSVVNTSSREKVLATEMRRLWGEEADAKMAGEGGEAGRRERTPGRDEGMGGGGEGADGPPRIADEAAMDRQVAAGIYAPVVGRDLDRWIPGDGGGGGR